MMAQRWTRNKTIEGAANSRRIPQWLSFAGAVFAVTLVAAAVAGPAYAAGPTLTSNAVVSNSGAILVPSWETFAAGSKKHAKPINLDEGPATGLVAPAGVAITLDGHVYIADSLANAVLGFAGTADGNTAPEVVIAGPDTGLNTPDGVVFDADGNLVVTNSLGAFCTTTPAASCTTSSSDLCAVGSVTVYPPGSDGDAVPSVTFSGCDSVLFEPVGVVADTVTLSVFLDFGGGCDFFLFSEPTIRYWVSDLAVGFVTSYLLGFGSAPAGGFFPTTTDNLLLASIGGTSVDLSAPDYLALGTSGVVDSPKVYVSDDTLGYKGRGRIKEFDTFTAFPICAPIGGGVAISWPFQAAAFDSSIEGKKTKLAFPQGIASLNTGSGDAIFVVNTDKNSLEEFSPGASGNVKPLIKISGARTKMHEPVGLAVPGAVATPIP